MTTHDGTERRYVDLLLVASAVCPLQVLQLRVVHLLACCPPRHAVILGPAYLT